MKGHKEVARAFNGYVDTLIGQIYDCHKSLLDKGINVTADALKNEFTVVSYNINADVAAILMSIPSTIVIVLSSFIFIRCSNNAGSSKSILTPSSVDCSHTSIITGSKLSIPDATNRHPVRFNKWWIT